MATPQKRRHSPGNPPRPESGAATPNDVVVVELTEVDHLRGEVADLLGEVADLREQVGALLMAVGEHGAVLARRVERRRRRINHPRIQTSEG